MNFNRIIFDGINYGSLIYIVRKVIFLAFELILSFNLI